MDSERHMSLVLPNPGQFLALVYLLACSDQVGNVLDVRVQSRRDKGVAKKFFRNLLKKLQYIPSPLITVQSANLALLALKLGCHCTNENNGNPND
jgi:transposase-like protein